MNLGEFLNIIYDTLGKDAYGGIIQPDKYNNALSFVNSLLTENYAAVKDKNQMWLDDCAPFISVMGDNSTPFMEIDSWGYGVLPDDYEGFLNAQIVTYKNIACNTSDDRTWYIEMLSQAAFKARESSRGNSFRPSLKTPIGTIQEGKYLVRPKGITKVRFTYMRSPATPYFDYDINQSTGLPVYLPPGALHDGTNPNYPAGTPSLSVEFEWPQTTHETVIFNALIKYFTVNIRDFEIMQIEQPTKP